MARGMKPLAYLFIRDDRFGDDFEVDVHLFVGWPRYLVYRRGNERLANSWKRSDEMFFAGKISLVSAHARRGVLLGYTKDQIRSYVRGRGRWETLK
jgi:hypothetical protein